MSGSQLLSAFDLDGTLLKTNISFEFSFYLYRKKLFSFFHLCHLFFLYFRHRRGKLSIYDLHQKAFTRLFFLKNTKELTSLLDDFFSKLVKKLYLPALERLKERNSKGDRILLLSSSPSFLVAPFAKILGIKECIASDYEVDKEGRLCGIATIIDGAFKARILLKKAQEWGTKETIAYSDSFFDLAFLQAASVPIAVRPDNRLKKLSRLKGWEQL